MTPEHTRTLIAVIITVGFFCVVAVVLLGFVDIEKLELAKLTGLIVGYLVGLLNPIILRYFERSEP